MLTAFSLFNKFIHRSFNLGFLICNIGYGLSQNGCIFSNFIYGAGHIFNVFFDLSHACGLIVSGLFQILCCILGILCITHKLSGYIFYLCKRWAHTCYELSHSSVHVSNFVITLSGDINCKVTARNLFNVFGKGCDRFLDHPLKYLRDYDNNHNNRY